MKKQYIALVPCSGNSIFFIAKPFSNKIISCMPPKPYSSIKNHSLGKQEEKYFGAWNLHQVSKLLGHCVIFCIPFSSPQYCCVIIDKIPRNHPPL